MIMSSMYDAEMMASSRIKRHNEPTDHSGDDSLQLIAARERICQLENENKELKKKLANLEKK